MKVSKYNFFMQIIYVVLLFQIALQNSSIGIISFIFNYADDAIAAMCIVYVIMKLISGKKLEENDVKILKVYSFFCIIGFLGSLLFRIQIMKAVLMDFFVCSKFLFGYLAARLYCGKFKTTYIGKSLVKVTKVIVILLFILALNDEFLAPIYSIFDYRYFGKSIMLMYPHPTYLASACIVMMLVLSVANEKKENIIYLIMLTIIIVFTFRVKAIAFVVVYWGLYTLRYILNVKNRLVYGGAACILAIFVGYDQFISYFRASTWSARSVLFTDALSLAKKYFPFGAGFGTFGTNMSVVYYSSIYSTLGYNKINGMSKETAAYLNDGFWQATLAQFGFIGCVLFIIIIYLFFKASLKDIGRLSPLRQIALISLNVYLIIASLGELAYFAPYAITYYLILGAVLYENRIITLSEKR